MESLVAWAKEIIEEDHGPPMSVIAGDVLLLAQRVKNAERENEWLREGLEQIAKSNPKLPPASRIAWQALRLAEERDSASEESSDE